MQLLHLVEALRIRYPWLFEFETVGVEVAVELQKIESTSGASTFLQDLPDVLHTMSQQTERKLCRPYKSVYARTE